ILIVGGVVVVSLRRRRPLTLPPVGDAGRPGAGLVAVAGVVGEWGATPGQRLLGLRVVDVTTGENLSFRRALVRTAVPSAVSLVRLVLGPLWTEARQRRQEPVRERLATVQE